MWFSAAVASGKTEAESPLDELIARMTKAQLVAAWQTNAARGDLEDQFKLGSAYARGDGVVIDFAEAVKWYRAAATRGHPEAQLKLG